VELNADETDLFRSTSAPQILMYHLIFQDPELIDLKEGVSVWSNYSDVEPAFLTGRLCLGLFGLFPGDFSTNRYHRGNEYVCTIS